MVLLTVISKKIQYLAARNQNMSQSEVIELYQPALRAIAFRILRCQADAEDAVQDTFMKWLNAEHETIRNTRAYLIRAVTNNCINRLNALKRQQEECLATLNWDLIMDRIRDTDFPKIDIEARLQKALAILQQKLEPLERAVFILKELFDFDYQMLQELLNRKQEHCRQLLCRARKKLSDERHNLAMAIQPRTAALHDAFNKACTLGHVSDLINYLRQDVTKAISKNF